MPQYAYIQHFLTTANLLVIKPGDRHLHTTLLAFLLQKRKAKLTEKELFEWHRKAGLQDVIL